MAFGKRSAGDLPPRHPSEDDAIAPEGLAASSAGVRTRVINKGEVDRGFIGLAAGVVLLAGGGAIAIPSLFSLLAGGVKPIPEVIAGLDRAGVRQVIALQAFPDADGRAFMTGLAASFPRAHADLVNDLADAAVAGGDRDDLFKSFNAWSFNFAAEHKDVVVRTGAEGFDKGVAAIKEGMNFLESEAGGCTTPALTRLMQRPTLIADLTRYDSRAYHFNMRIARDFVDLAARGSTARAIDTKLTANDMNSLQATFYSLLSDPQISGLVQMAAASGGDPRNIEAAVADKLNVCQLGRTVVIKLEGLPAGTKARMFGTLLSGDLASGFDMRSLGAPAGAFSFRR